MGHDPVHPSFSQVASVPSRATPELEGCHPRRQGGSPTQEKVQLHDSPAGNNRPLQQCCSGGVCTHVSLWDWCDQMQRDEDRNREEASRNIGPSSVGFRLLNLSSMFISFCLQFGFTNFAEV